MASAACQPDIPDDVYGKQLFAIVPTTIVLTLSITSYVLRLVARKRTGQELGWDDWLMGAGLIIILEPSICEYLLIPNGLGRHFCNLTKEQQGNFSKITFALQRANQPALACVKTSIILFYMRIFVTKQFRFWAYVGIAYTLMWAIATWFVNLTVCTPIAYYYDRTIPGGSCRNQAISGTVNGGLSLLGDVYILALPLPSVLSLKLNPRKKAAVLGIFLLGCFVCVASIIRLVVLVSFTPNDPTYTQVYASTWTTLEQGVAVISGNLPLLAPFFDRFFRNRRGRTGYGSSGNTNDMGAGTNKWNSRNQYGERSQTGIATVSGAASSVGSKMKGHDFERLSDTDSQAPGEIEMDDRAILVKTQVTVTEERKRDRETDGDREAEPRSWLNTAKA